MTIEKGNTFFMELIDRFKDYLRYEKRYSQNTINSYCVDIMGFILFMKPVLADSLSLLQQIELMKSVQTSHIRMWMVDMMDKHILARSVNRKIASLSTFYHFLQLENLVETNPFKSIIKPKQVIPLPSFFSEKDMDSVLEEDFENTYEGVRDRTILELLYATGMRVSELTNLKYKDISISEKVIKVLGKGNKERLIPLTDVFIPILEDYIEMRNQCFANITANDYLFLTSKGQPIYRKLVYRMVNEYMSKISMVKKCSPHVIRHTFATHLLNNGADINAIKTLLGHASLAATQVYTHTTIEHLKEEYKHAHPRAIK